MTTLAIGTPVQAKEPNEIKFAICQSHFTLKKRSPRLFNCMDLNILQD